MRLIRLILVPLIILALSAQGMAAVSMLGCAESPRAVTQHGQHGMNMDEAGSASKYDAKGLAHQHGSKLCAYCSVCPGAAVLNTYVGAVAQRLPSLPVATVPAGLFSVFVELADKPPKLSFV